MSTATAVHKHASWCVCQNPHLGNIVLLQLQLGELCVCGMLVGGGGGEGGPRLGLQQGQEGSIAVWPPIQAAKVCATCTTNICSANSSL